MSISGLKKKEEERKKREKKKNEKGGKIGGKVGRKEERTIPRQYLLSTHLPCQSPMLSPALANQSTAPTHPMAALPSDGPMHLLLSQHPYPQSISLLGFVGIGVDN